jgi:hypothetical protein
MKPVDVSHTGTPVWDVPTSPQGTKALCKARRIDRTTRLYVTMCGGLVKQRINARHPMTVAQRWKDVTCKDCLVLKEDK